MAEILTELVARIKTDSTQLEKGLTDAEKQTEASSKKMAASLKTVGVAMAASGAAITAAMTGAIMSFTETGSTLHDLSLKTGVSAKALAGLKYAAEQNGASLGTVEMALRRTASAMQDAKDGLTETQRAFDRMGLSLIDLKGLNPEEQFMKIAGAIANIPDPMTRAATAQDLFGRSGMDMLPMLSEGADGLKRMMEEGIKLTKWTNEGADSADALGDAFGTLTASTMGIFNAIGSSLAPVLMDLADKITGLISKVVEWTREHPELAKVLTIVAIALGVVLTVMGGLILILPTIISGIAAFGIVLHVALGPIGLISLAIAGLIAIGVLLWQNWDTITAKASEIWNSIANFFTNIWDRITGIFRDNWEKILLILFPAAGVVVLFAQHWDEIKDYFTNLWGSITGIFTNWWDNVKDFLAGLNPWNIIKDNWNQMFEGIKSVMHKIFGSGIIQETFDNAADYLRQKSLEFENLGYEMMEGLQRGVSGIPGVLSRIVGAAQAAAAAVTAAAQQMAFDLAAIKAGGQGASGPPSTPKEERAYFDYQFRAMQMRWREGILKWRAGDIGGALKAVLTTEYGTPHSEMNDRLYAAQSVEEVQQILIDFYGIPDELNLPYKAFMDAFVGLLQRGKTPGWGSEAFSFLNEALLAGADWKELERLMREWSMREGSIQKYQTGGKVEQTGLAYLHAGERVLPANESMGNVVINFTQPVFFDREDTMNRFVDMIRKGIQRQDRLRFGGAYSGG